MVMQGKYTEEIHKKAAELYTLLEDYSRKIEARPATDQPVGMVKEANDAMVTLQLISPDIEIK